MAASGVRKVRPLSAAHAAPGHHTFIEGVVMEAMMNSSLARRADDAICNAYPALPAIPYLRNWSPPIDRDAEELHFMLGVYSRTGGVIPGDEVASAMADHYDRPAFRLARWVVDREIVSFSWRTVLLLPRFQFHGPSLGRPSAIVTAMHDLREVLSDWDAALWFALPNAELNDSAPADCFSLDPSAVCRAAANRRFFTPSGEGSGCSQSDVRAGLFTSPFHAKGKRSSGPHRACRSDDQRSSS